MYCRLSVFFVCHRRFYELNSPDDYEEVMKVKITACIYACMYLERRFVA